jgi:signal peptidase II
MAAVIITSVLFVIFDRFLKVLAYQYFTGNAVSLVGGILSYSFAENYRIAFSLPLSGSILHVLVFLMIIILLFAWLGQIKKQRFDIAAALTFIIIGAISNLLDRWLYGFVIDYFNLKYFTVFNIADMMITGGVLAILFITIKGRGKCS